MNHLLILWLAAVTLQASADMNRPFPYATSSYCKNFVLQYPEGSTPPYRSEDCNTVYVLPPQFGSLDYTVQAPTISDGECNDYRERYDAQRKAYTEKRNLESAALKPNISEREYNHLQTKIDRLQKSMDRNQADLDKLANTAAVELNVKMSSLLTEELSRFQNTNLLLFLQGARFEAVPISESYVSFESVGEEDLRQRRAIVYSDIPGVEVRGVKSAPKSDTRIMNGSVAGKMVLGLNAVCNMREQQQVSSVAKVQFTPSQLESYVTANLTYSVPVMTSYGYYAKLKYKTVVTDLLKRLEDRPDQFTLHAFTDEVLKANGEENIVWNFKSYELAKHGVTSEEIKQIEDDARHEVFGKFTERVADGLSKMGVLEKMTPVLIPAPLPGTTEETRYQKQCSRHWLLGSSCYEQSYRVVTLHGATADQAISLMRSYETEFEQTLEFSQPIYRPHTSTFKFRSQK